MPSIKVKVNPLIFRLSLNIKEKNSSHINSPYLINEEMSMHKSVAAPVRFELTHRLPCLTDFKSAPLNHLGTAPYKNSPPHMRRTENPSSDMSAS